MNITVLVTGASRGIGRAIASAFAAEGDRLIITCSRSEQELLNFKKELEETFHTEVFASVGDISSFEYVEQLFEQITERFGGVDVLINNAGISYIGLLTDMSIDDWNRIVSTNNPKEPQKLIHKTIPGILVRSKSEALIINALFEHKIPFRYECLLQIQNVSIYPDFTIRHPVTGEVYYWEHFGMMDNENYAHNVYSKLQL